MSRGEGVNSIVLVFRLIRNTCGARLAHFIFAPLLKGVGKYREGFYILARFKLHCNINLVIGFNVTLILNETQFW